MKSLLSRDLLYLLLITSLTIVIFGCCEPSTTLFEKSKSKSFLRSSSKIIPHQVLSSSVSAANQKFQFRHYSSPRVVAGAKPVSIVSADFDHDRTPDVVAGYADGETGVLVIQNGIQQKDYNDDPFSENGSSIAIPLSPDFLVAGDFDVDGNEDLASAAQGGNRIHMFKGDGHGNFTIAQELNVPNAISILFAADINRRDRKISLIVGGRSADGPQFIVLEGENGVFSGHPEVYDLPSEAIAFAADDFDQDFWIDLAIATKTELIILYGCDSRRKNQSSSVRMQRIPLNFVARSMVSGKFESGNIPNLALLSDKGKIHHYTATKKSEKIKWERRSLARGLWPNSSGLIRARVTANPLDDLVLIDKQNSRLYIIAPTKDDQRYTQYSSIASKPAALIAQRINQDALTDLLILENEPGHFFFVALTQPQASYVVNLSSDETDADLQDGVCDVDLNTPLDQCTLRAAIQQANFNTGFDFIHILDNVTSISPLTPLPVITDPVQLSPISSESPKTIISGANLTVGSNGLQVQAGSSVIADLVINGFDTGAVDCGIEIDTNGNNFIADSFIGTDETGTAAVGNRLGICIINSPDNIISDSLISGNINAGIRVFGNSATGTSIHDNLIGTDVTGSGPLGNGLHGLDSLGADSNDIRSNVISANGGNGILLRDGSSITLSKVGTDIAGTIPLGNDLLGISIVGSNNTIGSDQFQSNDVISANLSGGIAILGNNNFVAGIYVGTNPENSDLGNNADGILIQNGSDNLIKESSIAYNKTNGIRVLGNGAERNHFGNNNIYSNVNLGIDLGGDGVTSNDVQDSDTGPNGLQNYPILISAIYDGAFTSLNGTLNSLPNTEFEFDAYSSSSCDPSGFGEGDKIENADFTFETTDSNGDVSFGMNLGEDVAVGSFVTAIASRTGGSSGIESSEFSACIQVTAAAPQSTCTLEPASVTLDLGEEIVVKAIVLDGNGTPASGVPITFTISAAPGEYWNEHTTTDSLGEAFTSGLIAIVPVVAFVSGSVEMPEGRISCSGSTIVWVLHCEENPIVEHLERNAKFDVLKDLLLQYPRLKKYRERVAPFSVEITSILAADSSLLFRTTELLSNFNHTLRAIEERKIVVIDSNLWRMLQDLLVSYEQKASPELKKVLQELNTDLQRSEFQHDVGFLVATKPIVQEEK